MQHTGPDLYRLVEDYAALGEHRTGSAVDAATRDWFCAELQRRGGSVERRPFRFDRYDSEVEVRIDGRCVAALALYYEALGSVASDSPHVAAIAALDSDGGAAALAQTIADARAAAAGVAVVATLNPLGELQAPNRWPQPGSGFPVVLVPGREANALRTGKVSVQWRAALAQASSENILATFGDTAAVPPLLIATPLSGWFGCAAERGTGIALALALAAHVAARHPVLVVGSPGHELLPHIGLAALLAHGLSAPALVVHLGANVALGQRDVAGAMGFAPQRAIGTRMDAGRHAALCPWLERLGVTPRLDPPRWVGEGALWALAVQAPLISFVGIGPQFHTPADTPEQTTSPELLQTAFDAISGALDAWCMQEAPPAARGR